MSVNEYCGCITLDCSTCLNYSIPYCPPSTFNIPSTNLTSGATYYIWITDKNNNTFWNTVTGNSDGSFTINQASFPNGMFTSQFGGTDIFLSTDNQGTQVQSLTINAVVYKCVIVSIADPVYITLGCNLLSTNNQILLNE
jgi:hypothetical protein